MIEIPIPIETCVLDKGNMFLVFEDKNRARIFSEMIMDYIAKSGSSRRLEVFEDGIYFDGEPIDVKGKSAAILRCFQFVNKVRCIDLIERVWGSSIASEASVAMAIHRVNERIEKFGFITKNEGFYELCMN